MKSFESYPIEEGANLGLSFDQANDQYVIIRQDTTFTPINLPKDFVEGYIEDLARLESESDVVATTQAEVVEPVKRRSYKLVGLAAVVAATVFEVGITGLSIANSDGDVLDGIDTSLNIQLGVVFDGLNALDDLTE